MALSSEEVANKAFSSVRRGYDPDEVRAYLKQVASEGISARSDETGPHADVEHAADDVRTVLIAAREAAAKLKETTDREVQAISDRAADEVHDLRSNATREATATLEQAKQRADELVQEAKRYASEQREAADRERKELLEGATREHQVLMEEKAQLQESAARAERALATLQSALRSGNAPSSGGDSEREPESEVLNLDSTEAPAGHAR